MNPCPRQHLHEAVTRLYPLMSASAVAAQLGVSARTVQRVVKELGLTRSKEEEKRLRSNARKELVRAERRRGIFGLPQKTNLKVFSNYARSALKSQLKKKGYIVVRKIHDVYYNAQTRRSALLEARGPRLGVRFHPQTD